MLFYTLYFLDLIIHARTSFLNLYIIQIFKIFKETNE